MGTTELNNPTPDPLMILPTSIIVYPIVKVCIAPPTVNMHAPRKRVNRRPFVSDRCAERREVTV
jgi:hypothetical protein